MRCVKNHDFKMFFSAFFLQSKSKLKSIYTIKIEPSIMYFQIIDKLLPKYVMTHHHHLVGN